MARKNPLDIRPFGTPNTKNRAPAILVAAIAALLIAALGGAYLLYQEAYGQSAPAGAQHASQSSPQAALQPPPQCAGWQVMPCAISGCPGNRTCGNGFYSDCVLPRKICVPGSQVGCSTDSCKFGYATCNPCGTGYGQCLPPPGYNATNSTPPCTSASCG